MITVTKVTGKDGKVWYDMQLIHPLSNEKIMEGDGFETTDEIIAFASDLASAVTGAYIAPGDIAITVEEKE